VFTPATLKVASMASARDFKMETREFTEKDLEPLTKTQLIHVIVSGVQGFDGMERTIKWQHGDSCPECRSIANQLGLHEEESNI